MSRRNIGFITLMIAILASGSFAQERKVSLTLEECIVSAMKNNLGVAVEVLNPDIAQHTVSLAKEIFLPELSFNYNDQNTITPSYSFFDGGDQVSTLFSDFTVNLNQFIPTGGRLAVDLNIYKNDTTRRLQTINPRYGATLTLNFTQPLLKNFGLNINRREIIIASNNLEISEYQMTHNLLSIIYSVEEAYWNLAYSTEDLKVKQQSLKLARDLLEENKRKVEVGTMAPIEIYTAEAEVATREADILQAEALVKNNEDLLKTIINLPEMETADLVEIIPEDNPASDKREINVEEAMVTALANRPDLKAMKMDLKNQELNLSYAKNQLLPELNFQASYWSPGISGDQILYSGGNPLTGEIIGTIPGGLQDALRDAFDFKYNNWSLGLTLSIPVNTLLSRAEYARAKVNVEQTLFKLKNQKQQIYLEIKTAVRGVQTNYKRVQAYRAARALAQKKLEAEHEKFNVGKSTNYFILLFQRDVANARSAELKAMVDYALSLAHLDRVLGTTFESKNIKFYEAGLNSKPQP
ncbi:MAG: TolC family protein [Candidatus Aminicenantes bacterium]|nr:TolC family protein [Candidatus Aminicenantes bacterium]